MTLNIVMIMVSIRVISLNHAGIFHGFKNRLSAVPIDQRAHLCMKQLIFCSS